MSLTRDLTTGASRLTLALSCTADEVQSQCAAAFAAEARPPRRRAESRVSFNAWLGSGNIHELDR
jgi:hypothetical protein